MDIRVLGACCANCHTTAALIEQVANPRDIPVNLEKVEDLRAIVSYGVMSTPGVVVDGNVVHAGGVPSRENGVRREGRFLRYSANAAALQELLRFLYAECCTRNRAVEPRNVVCAC